MHIPADYKCVANAASSDNVAMDITDFEFPILQSFFCLVEKRSGRPVQPLTPMAEEQLKVRQEREEQDGKPATLPKGVVLGPDGKP